MADRARMLGTSHEQQLNLDTWLYTVYLNHSMAFYKELPEAAVGLLGVSVIVRCLRAAMPSKTFANVPE